MSLHSLQIWIVNRETFQLGHRLTYCGCSGRYIKQSMKRRLQATCHANGTRDIAKCSAAVFSLCTIFYVMFRDSNLLALSCVVIFYLKYSGNQYPEWMPEDLVSDKSRLVRLVDWCRQSASHYLNACWPRLPTLLSDATKLQWDNGEKFVIASNV